MLEREEGSSFYSVADFNQEQKVSLKDLSEMTGFPVEMINKELFTEDDRSTEDGVVSIDLIRERICKFVDRVFLD